MLKLILKNILTFDIEDWFHPYFGENIIKRENWSSYTSKIDLMVDEILELLDRYKFKATFFVLGWFCQSHKQVVKKIFNNGHEIASHGYWHKQVYNQKPEEFFQDILITKKQLEDIIGTSVKGYRAPGYSINTSMQWALDKIKQAEYFYDSSLLDLKKNIHFLDNGLLEISPNSIKLLGKNFPSNGGFFFRAIPWFIYKLYLKNLNKKKKLIFYTHSWEVKNVEEKIELKGFKKFIQYYNIKNVNKKIKKLFRYTDFQSINEYLIETNKI